jgi:uncharacterized membrane protein
MCQRETPGSFAVVKTAALEERRHMAKLSKAELVWNRTLTGCVIALALTIGASVWQLAFPERAQASMKSCVGVFCIENTECISLGCFYCDNVISRCEDPGL